MKMRTHCQEIIRGTAILERSSADAWTWQWQDKQSGHGEIKAAHKRKWIERVTELYTHSGLFWSILPGSWD